MLRRSLIRISTELWQSCYHTKQRWLLGFVSCLLVEQGSVVPMMYLNPNLSTGRIRLVSEEFPSWFIVTTDTGVADSNRIYFFSIFMSSVLNDFGMSTVETPRVMALLRVNGRDWSLSSVPSLVEFFRKYVVVENKFKMIHTYFGANDYHERERKKRENEFLK